jgi:hypothetical protein
LDRLAREPGVLGERIDAHLLAMQERHNAQPQVCRWRLVSRSRHDVLPALKCQLYPTIIYPSWERSNLEVPWGAGGRIPAPPMRHARREPAAEGIAGTVPGTDSLYWPLARARPILAGAVGLYWRPEISTAWELPHCPRRWLGPFLPLSSPRKDDCDSTTKRL